MAREPSYPEDAAVGAQPEGSEEAGKAGESTRTKHLVAGAAIGIGSAALVAALLYANRSRGKSDKKSG
jgi:hypothetical protein